MSVMRDNIADDEAPTGFQFFMPENHEVLAIQHGKILQDRIADDQVEGAGRHFRDGRFIKDGNPRMAAKASAQFIFHPRRGIEEGQPGTFLGHAVGRQGLAAPMVENMCHRGRNQASDVFREPSVVKRAMTCIHIDRMFAIPELAPGHERACYLRSTFPFEETYALAFSLAIMMTNRRSK